MGSLAQGRPLVPTIDVGPFLADPTSAAADEIIQAVRQACEETGFFQVTGHGMPAKIQQELFAAGRKFFVLPMEEKTKLDCRKTTGHRGYDVLESQTYDAEVPSDLKEGFFVGHDLPADDPVVQARRFFMGPNVWPPEDLLARGEFRAPLEAYFAAVNALAIRMLDLVARTLPYGPDVFAEFITGYVIAPLRVLHYPPARPEVKKQLGAGAHTDFGAITLLLQDGNPGLEVLHPLTGEFVPIEPTPGAFVFNVGDMLSSWTGGRYKSSVHRVINKNPVDRYSAAFFFDGSLDCPLDPLDGSQPKVPGLTVERHMIKRITDSYGKHTT